MFDTLNHASAQLSNADPHGAKRRSVWGPYLLLACCGLVHTSARAEEPSPRPQQPIIEVVVGSTLPDPRSAAVDGKVEPGPLNAPFGVAFEADGAMWIVEYDGGRIWQRLPDGSLNHVAGNGKLGYIDGPAKDASFNKLHNVIRLEDGRLLLSDHTNNAVRSFDPAAQRVSTLAGGGAGLPVVNGMPFSTANFNEPICVEFGRNHDEVLVADIRNRRLRVLNLKTNTIDIVAGNGKSGLPANGAVAVNSPLVDPRAAIATPDGTIYFLERNGNALRKISPDGKLETVAGSGEKGAVDGPALEATMNGPKHLCLGPKDVIYIADDVNHLVRCYDPQARTLTTVNLGDYRLNRPHGVAVRDGWLYISDSYNHRILRVHL